MGMRPRDGELSQDETLLAIAFDQVIILYDFRYLNVLTYLYTEDAQDHAYTCLKFGFGQHSRYLFTGCHTGLYVWDLISLQLVGKFNDIQNIDLITDDHAKNLYIQCSKGIFVLDASSKTSKISDISNIDALTVAPDRLYFMKGKKLKFSRTKPKSSDLIAPPTFDEVINQGLNLDQLKVTVDEDVFHARPVPPVDPESITKKVSLCSEFIIKKALPI